MRTLILMPDWNAVLFWRDAEGRGAVDEASLPISDALKLELQVYYAWFSELFFRNDCGERASITDRQLLDDRGLELWVRLGRELSGRHRVWFYSHEFNAAFESPEDFRITRGRAYA